ncbi:Vacuolar protein sorting-associated protein atg6 [Tilletia horrida]|nr:Vacuolar protein sorting-associated protein atg6 [Tilletia horrida]
MQCQECRRPIAVGARAGSSSSSAAGGGGAGSKGDKAAATQTQQKQRAAGSSSGGGGDTGTSPSSSGELRDTYDLVRQSALAITELDEGQDGRAKAAGSKGGKKGDSSGAPAGSGAGAGTDAGSSAGAASSATAGRGHANGAKSASNTGVTSNAVPPASRNSLSARLRLTEELAQLLSASPSPHAASLLPHQGSSSGAAQRKAQERDGKSASGAGEEKEKDQGTLIEHELCMDCCNALAELMRQQIEDLKREKDAYLAVEAELVKYRDEEVDVDAIQTEIEQLGNEEEDLLRELRHAEEVKASLEAELREMDAEEKELEAEEESFWVSYSALSSRLATLQNTHSALASSIAHDKLTLARLQLTNVYNDAFCVGHDGGFATINGLRLGRLPGANVEWTEINAAWGQTTLLLSVLARKCNFTFKGYVLHPKGSFSTIEKLGPDKAMYELHGSGDWQVARLLHSRRFDHGMVAFLECLRQLMAHASERDPTLRLPHAVNKDRIGEACIRLQFGQDETWTRALRHVLLTLKVLMVWVLKVTDDEGSQGQAQAART